MLSYRVWVVILRQQMRWPDRLNILRIGRLLLILLFSGDNLGGGAKATKLRILGTTRKVFVHLGSIRVHCEQHDLQY